MEKAPKIQTTQEAVESFFYGQLVAAKTFLLVTTLLKNKINPDEIKPTSFNIGATEYKIKEDQDDMLVLIYAKNKNLTVEETLSLLIKNRENPEQYAHIAALKELDQKKRLDDDIFSFTK
ncbi:MAG: hypothetical protein QM526_01325 [Alphaproteobacteria bacterium]|nr:hypothetical protein [Alphaproteobacteria bacterium]